MASYCQLLAGQNIRGEPDASLFLPGFCMKTVGIDQELYTYTLIWSSQRYSSWIHFCVSEAPNHLIPLLWFFVSVFNGFDDRVLEIQFVFHFEVSLRDSFVGNHGSDVCPGQRQCQDCSGAWALSNSPNCFQLDRVGSSTHIFIIFSYVIIFPPSPGLFCFVDLEPGPRMAACRDAPRSATPPATLRRRCQISSSPTVPRWWRCSPCVPPFSLSMTWCSKSRWPVGQILGVGRCYVRSW